MTEHRQRLDRSPLALLIVCTCGWREMVADEIAGWTAAQVHGQAVHDDGFRAGKAKDARISRERRARIDGVLGGTTTSERREMRTA